MSFEQACVFILKALVVNYVATLDLILFSFSTSTHNVLLLFEK